MIEKRSGWSRAGLLAASLVCLLGIAGCKSSSKSTAAAPSAAPPVDPYVTALNEYQNGQPDKAADHLKMAISEKPQSIMPRQLLATIYLDKKDYDRAEDEYQELTTLDPYTASNFYNLAYCQQILNQLPQAITNYQQALTLDPHDAKSAANLGVVYLSQNQYDDAVKSLDQATKLDDKSWYAWMSLGIALDGKGKYQDAEEAFRRSLELDPTQTAAIYNLGSNLILQGRATEAIPILQELVKRDDSIASHKKYAEALVASNNYSAAVAEYRKMIETDSQNYQLMNDLASLSIKQYQKEAEFDDNKKNTAVEMWQKSLAIQPNQPDIKALLKKWGGSK